MRGVGGGKRKSSESTSLLHQVDDLILDRPPSVCYVRSDDEYSRYAQGAFAAARARASKPSGCPDKVWQQVCAGVNEASRMRQGKDYAFDAEHGRYRLLDE